jgi:hypothetical protein
VEESISGFLVGSIARVECANASYHWEPPSDDPEVNLFCSNNGLWMDLEHFTIRKCVPNSLRCTPPLRDTGLGSCQMPPPTITFISISSSPGVRQVDDVTLAALPVQVTLVLTVRGSFFRRPLVVTVGGMDCLLPELLYSNDSLSLCSNGSTVGCEYADAFSCEVHGVLGSQLPVRVWSGPRFENVDVDDRLEKRLATVSTAHPVLLSMNSSACLASNSSAYQLLDCPVTADFYVDVWLDSSQRSSCYSTHYSR